MSVCSSAVGALRGRRKGTRRSERAGRVPFGPTGVRKVAAPDGILASGREAPRGEERRSGDIVRGAPPALRDRALVEVQVPMPPRRHCRRTTRRMEATGAVDARHYGGGGVRAAGKAPLPHISRGESRSAMVRLEGGEGAALIVRGRKIALLC